MLELAQLILRRVSVQSRFLLILNYYASPLINMASVHKPCGLLILLLMLTIIIISLLFTLCV